MTAKNCLICNRVDNADLFTCPACGEASWAEVVQLFEQLEAEGLLESDKVEVTDEVVTQVEVPAPKKKRK